MIQPQVNPVVHESQSAARTAEGDVTWFDILVIIISMGFHLLDVGSDVYLIYFYWKNREYWFFSLTFAFVVIPSVIMNLFCYWMYYKKDVREVFGNKPCGVTAVIKVTLLLLQLGPLILHFETLVYGLRYKRSHLRSERRSHYHKMMGKCEYFINRLLNSKLF